MEHPEAETEIDGIIIVDPTRLPADDGRSEYTVPIPDDLTDFFRPSQHVTLAQMDRFNSTGREPYPGYADELNEWERRWELVNDAQAKADGHPIQRLDTVHIGLDEDGLGLPDPDPDVPDFDIDTDDAADDTADGKEE